jgi:hypothetical protein
MKANIILGLTGSIVTLGLIFELLRKRYLREKYAVFWVTVALFTLAVAAFPGLLSSMSAFVGVSVPSNLLFFLASMVLLFVSVQHSYELGRMEERTRTLAEAIGLLQMDLEERASGRSEADPHPDGK